jgi:hypothetical protein
VAKEPTEFEKIRPSNDGPDGRVLQGTARGTGEESQEKSPQEAG